MDGIIPSFSLTGGEKESERKLFRNSLDKSCLREATRLGSYTIILKRL